MNIVRLNTVALGNAIIKKGGGSGGGTPSYENGVYIQHINRKLYTTSEWESGAFSNDKANGVALITDNARFVIAKTDVSAKMAWSSNTDTLVDGILATNDSEIAKTDFAGYENTQLMLATDTSGAGFSCANYIFPSGDKGYLPALGELNEAYLNKSAIDSAMTLIGGTAMLREFYWSSSQLGSSYSWRLAWLNGNINHNYKYSKEYVRVFTTLNFK